MPSSWARMTGSGGRLASALTWAALERLCAHETAFDLDGFHALGRFRQRLGEPGWIGECKADGSALFGVVSRDAVSRPFPKPVWPACS